MLKETCSAMFLQLHMDMSTGSLSSANFAKAFSMIATLLLHSLDEEASVRLPLRFLFCTESKDWSDLARRFGSAQGMSTFFQRDRNSFRLMYLPSKTWQENSSD